MREEEGEEGKTWKRRKQREGIKERGIYGKNNRGQCNSVYPVGIFKGRIVKIYKKTTITKLKQDDNDIFLKVSMFYRYIHAASTNSGH